MGWPKLTRYTTTAAAASILLSQHFLLPFTSFPPFAFPPFKRPSKLQPTRKKLFACAAVSKQPLCRPLPDHLVPHSLLKLEPILMIWPLNIAFRHETHATSCSNIRFWADRMVVLYLATAHSSFREVLKEKSVAQKVIIRWAFNCAHPASDRDRFYCCSLPL